MNVFIDTNLWIYALLEPQQNKAHEVYKRDIIIHLLENSQKKENIILSVQVLNEFHSTMKRKYKINESIIRDKINNGILSLVNVIPVQLSDYKLACKIRDKYNFSYWDSIIVSAAINYECKFLYSEDMQDNLIVFKQLKIINPFVQKKEHFDIF